jgi:lysophospholipase L1-like esterase
VRLLLTVAIASAMTLAGCAQPSREDPVDPPQLSPMAVQDANFVGVISDSYTAGSPQGGTGAANWTRRSGELLRAHGVQFSPVEDSVGGSGYTVAGRRKDGQFLDQVERIAGTNDKIVILFGSRNDAHRGRNELAAAVDAALSRTRELAPNAQILVIGPAWTGHVARQVQLSDLEEVRDVVQDRATAAGAMFIDPIADGWFPPDRPDLIGADNVHPTDSGHEYMAGQIAPVIEQLLHAAQSGQALS